MKNPILIDSSIEFAIVGPIRLLDGVLVRSEIANIELIGFANKIYRKEEWLELNPKWQKTMVSSNIGYAWSRYFQVGNRKTKYLLCFKPDKPNSSNQNLIQNAFIEDELNKFLENASSIITNLSMSGVISAMNLKNVNVTHELTWKISPLILQCNYPGMDLSGRFI